MKVQVSQQIRSNEQLEQDLKVMDMKIGLLVKNRLAVEDVGSYSQKDVAPVAAVGLTKANQEKLEV